MDNGIRLNKVFGSKLGVGFQVWHETSEEAQITHRPKHCEYNDEGNCPNTPRDKNYQAYFRNLDNNNWVHLMNTFLQLLYT